MRTLEKQIEQKNEELLEIVPTEKFNQFGAYISELVSQNLAQNSIKAGDVIPTCATLTNINGKDETLGEILSAPTVITFYRGSWCPYCNLELRAYQNILPQIKQKGAKLVAISPELPDGSLTHKEQLELEFDVYSDVNNEFARKLGLVFKLDDKIKALQKELGMDVDATNGNTTGELPFAATFVVDKCGKITYAFVDENYTKRAEPADILAELDKIVINNSCQNTQSHTCSSIAS